jgi:hypothetical protein
MPQGPCPRAVFTIWLHFNDSPQATALTAMLTHTSPAQAPDIESDFWRELAEIEAESIGWLALGEGCYLHTGTPASVVLIVGTASASLVGHNVLWVY